MPIVTLDGQIGAGAVEVGRMVARQISADYYDRLFLAGVARRIGATVEAVAEKERRLHRLSDRFMGFVGRALRGMAFSGGALQYMPPDPATLALVYEDMWAGPKLGAYEVEDREYIRAAREQIREVASGGRAVIVHRAACLELRDEPKALRVGLFAPLGERIQRLVVREGFPSSRDAHEALLDRERAQAAYFKAIGGADPRDQSIYDMVLSTTLFNLEEVAQRISEAVDDLMTGRRPAPVATT
jgi:cytidylate kinase